MGDMTAHFDRSEFTCKCGCGKSDISPDLVNKLEQIYAYFARTPTGCKSIIITSGLRCSAYSPKVGGYSNDAHTKGIAADIVVYKADGTRYAAEQIAAVAEKCGFSGIGLMNNACHVDIRNKNNYVNAHWFGDERTGNNSISSFLGYLPPLATSQPVKSSTHTIAVMFDGKTIFEKEF